VVASYQSSQYFDSEVVLGCQGNTHMLRQTECRCRPT